MAFPKNVNAVAPEAFPGQIGNHSIMKVVGVVTADANVKIGNGLFVTANDEYLKGVGATGDRFVGVAVGNASRATTAEGLSTDLGNMIGCLLEGDVYVYLTDIGTIKTGDFVFCATATGDLRAQATTTAIAGHVLTTFRVQRVLTDNIIAGKKMALISTAYNASAVV